MMTQSLLSLNFIYIKLRQERGLATFVHLCLINEDFYMTKDFFLFFFFFSSGAGSNKAVTKHVFATQLLDLSTTHSYH